MYSEVSRIMFKWGQVNQSNVVENIIIADDVYIEEVKENNPEYRFIKSSDDNEAYVGFEYSESLKKFSGPSIFPSWVWDSENWEWVPPTPKPDEGYWHWDEDLVSWVEDLEIEYPEGHPHHH
jgi:hypothetical protein